MLIEELRDPPQYQIFVDLDGVLADFVKGVSQIMDGSYNDERFENDPQYRKKMWKAVADYKGELWYDLDMMPDGPALWKYVRQYDPEILTATGDPKHGAGPQKIRWVAEKLGPHVKVNLTRKAAEKAQHACESCILIDDKQKAILPWTQAGGIGILHTSAQNTIRQLKDLGL